MQAIKQKTSQTQQITCPLCGSGRMGNQISPDGDVYEPGNVPPSPSAPETTEPPLVVLGQGDFRIEIDGNRAEDHAHATPAAVLLAGLILLVVLGAGIALGSLFA